MKALGLVVLVAAGCAEERPRELACPDCAGRIHPPGILDPESDEFHGALLARMNYAFGRCTDCHGEDFAGGVVGVSCTTCHEEGPTECGVCHAPHKDSPTHAVHRRGGSECADCHPVPVHWAAPGHIVDDEAPAEVRFGPRAERTIEVAERAGPATWDGERCSNVYCHGDVRRTAFAGTDTRPRWDQEPTSLCSTGCHGLPPPDHPSANCIQCHAGLRHVDGVVQVSAASRCYECHGTERSPAPPTGAHEIHVGTAVACESCHIAPATVEAPMHIDAPPAEVKADAGFDPLSGSCMAWCHSLPQQWRSQ